VNTPKTSNPDTLVGIGTALRTGLAVPTDTMITEDIPLLLTRLSGVPYTTEAHVISGRRDTAAPPES